MVQLSTRGRYATRVVVFLAMQHAAAPVRKQRISDAEDISPDYLEQILVRLKSAGLVRSYRGVNGGFMLEGSAEDITVGDIVRVMEGDVSLAPCDMEGCGRFSSCVTRDVWKDAGCAMEKVLDGVKISDLARKAEKLRDSRSLSFSI